MSTHNICFHGEIRKISAFFGWKKRLICCYDYIEPFIVVPSWSWYDLNNVIKRRKMPNYYHHQFLWGLARYVLVKKITKLHCCRKCIFLLKWKKKKKRCVSYSATKTCYGHLLDAPHGGPSNKYPHLMFSWRNKSKKMITIVFFS